MRFSIPARIQILAAAILFSTGGAAIKACSLSSWQVAGYRSAIAALALFALLPRARRGHGPASLMVGLAYAATLILFVIATKWTTSANAIFLQDTAPAYVLLLSPWLLGERLNRRDLPFILAMGGGMLLFFFGAQLPVASAPRPVEGNYAALLSGLTFALTLIGIRWLRAEAAPAVAAGNVLACVLALPMMLPLAAISAADWLLLLYLGVFQVGLAYVLLTAATPAVTALEVSLLLLLEPVLNPVWSWIFHGEAPSLLAIAGGGCILGASTLRAIRMRAG